MSPEVHPSAAVGFELAAAAYERGRPSFPAEAIARLTDVLGLGRGRTVLELGAGTGKLTRLIVRTGADVVAVEPVDAMRRALLVATPNVDIVGATAERLPLRPGVVDAALAAQAFHWFDGPVALEELARLLPEEAPLALAWNVRDETEPWVRGITELIEPYRGDTPSHRSRRWLAAFDDAPDWPAPTSTSFRYDHVATRAETVDRMLSISFIATLDDETRRVVADGVRALVPPGDPVVFPYRTEVWLTRRRRSRTARGG